MSVSEAQSLVPEHLQRTYNQHHEAFANESVAEERGSYAFVIPTLMVTRFARLDYAISLTECECVATKARRAFNSLSTS